MQVKRCIKLVISLAFAAGSGAVAVVRRLAGRRSGATCTVLYYHDIEPEDGARFARQMDVLVRMARPVQADIAALPASSGRFAAVTFDDGFENLLVTALPELKKRGIPCTIFAITSAFGRVPSWCGETGRFAREKRLMTAEQLAQLPEALVVIGSHTVTHPNLPRIERSKACREISESRAALETVLNRAVRLFSFPYGAFNEELVEVCREAGYARVFTTLPSRAFSRTDSFVTGRVPVEPADWEIEFRLKLMGAYRWLPVAFSIKRALLQYLPWTGGRSPGMDRTATFREPAGN